MEDYSKQNPTTNKIQSFINTCLWWILQIHWPNTISYKELWKCTNQKPVDEEILQRRWRWIGHTLRKPATNTTRLSPKWNPQGKRKRRRPRNTRRRDWEADAKKMSYTWGQLEMLVYGSLRAGNSITIPRAYSSLIALVGRCLRGDMKLLI